MSSASLDLNRGFPPSDPAAWRAQAEKDLRGRPFEQLAWQTDEGFSLAPVPQAEAVQWAHQETALDPLFPTGPWRSRELVCSSTPYGAATQVRQAQDRGAEELHLVLDLVAQVGLDPDSPDNQESLAARFAGSVGTPIYRQPELALVLREVDLAKTRVSFEARCSSLPLLAALLETAARKGVHPDQLQVELGLDPLHELLLMPPRGKSIDQLLKECCETVRYCAAEARGVTPMAVHGQEIHRSGGNAAQELGTVLAAALTYVRTMLADGIPLDLALGSLTFRLPVGSELYLEVGKLRAARLLWARIAKVLGAGDDQLRMRLLAETSGRSRALWSDLRNNLVRTTVQSFAAISGGCDSLCVATFTAKTDNDDQQAQALARNQQILLREEGELHRVRDPLRGAHAIEHVTDELGRAAWNFFQAIESRGGVFEALQSGWLAEQISESAERRAESYRTRRRVLVGVSRYTLQEEDLRPVRARQIGEQAGRQRAIFGAHLAAGKQRKEAATLVALQAVQDADTDRMAALREAAANGATFGEMLAAMRGNEVLRAGADFNSYPLTDGIEFESLRSAPVRLPVLLAATGSQRKIARARLDFVHDLFRTGSFQPRDAGYHQDLEQLAKAMDDLDSAIEISAEDSASTPFLYSTRVVVLCADNEDWGDTLDRLPALLKSFDEVERETLLFVAGEPNAEIADRIEGFVYRGIDVPEFLDDLYRRLFSVPFARWQAEAGS